MFVSLITMILAGTRALVEVDIKKIVALSTLSQLRVMIFAVGVGVPEAALFHLLTHAIFKALLFLCVGVIIHINEGRQDLRLLGGAWERAPVRVGCIEVSLVALCGVPFLSGFYSKDWVIEAGIYSGLPSVFSGLVVVGVITRWLYSMRLVALVARGMTKGVKGSVVGEREGGCVKVSYSLLLSGRVMLGFFLSEVFDGFLIRIESIKEEKVLVLMLGLFSLIIFIVNSLSLKAVVVVPLNRFFGSI